jgi:CobQ-like glutamine amidotransferase family enzyme
MMAVKALPANVRKSLSPSAKKIDGIGLLDAYALHSQALRPSCDARHTMP